MIRIPSVCGEPSVYWYTHRYIPDKCYNVLGFPKNIVAGYITMQKKPMGGTAYSIEAPALEAGASIDAKGHLSLEEDPQLQV